MVPGKLVDSKITISLCLIIFEINKQAFFSGFKSGSLFLLTGVGTVTIKILQSFRFSILKVILFDIYLNSFFFNCKVISLFF